MSNNNFLLNYACHSNQSKGRYFKETEDIYRCCFKRDRDRIIHSNAFRKLEYKTQVFINYAHDYYRTRLTHSLEVAQISRSIAYRIGLNEDITECISLAHDLGHTPFGHSGEYALNKSIKNVNEVYDFDHNVQTIRILVYLEKKHIDFDGMNLSWEVIEGIAKHNGPLCGRYAKHPTENKLLLQYNTKYNLKLEEFSSAEGQIASISDDIAYSIHDLDDALRANFITLEDILNVPLIGKILQEMKNKYFYVPQNKIIHKTLSETIGIMINDVVLQTQQNIKDYGVENVDDIRKLNQPLVTFSSQMLQDIQEIKKFNMQKIYQHYKLKRTMNKAQKIIEELFYCFYENPELLPTEWYQIAIDSQRVIAICDYIAGMTDRFAIHEHRRIFDTSYEMTLF